MESSGSSSQQPKQSKRASAKTSASKTEDGLAPVQGSYEEARPPEDTPGDPAHLGSDRPYEGEPSPFVDEQRGS